VTGNTKSRKTGFPRLSRLSRFSRYFFAALSASTAAERLTAILLVRFHRVSPPKESMKAFLKNRRLK
jgi:hypothetical protein